MNFSIIKKLIYKPSLSFLFLLTIIVSTGISQSYHTLNIDGSNDFYQSQEKFNTSTPEHHAYFTWDSENLYLGYSGPKLIYNPDDSMAIHKQYMWWYIDTDPQSNPKTGNGTDTSLALYVNIFPLPLVVYNMKQWILPFNADYCLHVTYPGNRSGLQFLAVYSLDSLSWTHGQYLDSSLVIPDTINGYLEVKLPLSLIENPGSINILGYILSAEWVSEIYWEGMYPQRDIVGSYASFPPGSQDGGDGDKKTEGSFSQWFDYNLIGGITPNNPQYFVSDGVSVRAKVFLEGAYNSGSGAMNTTLFDNQMIPSQQPYNSSPWNYPGPELPSFMPQDITDWVLVELRKNAGPSVDDSLRAAFVKSDGSLVDIDGQFPVVFEKDPDDYYVVVHHRNHLSIMSANPISLSGSSPLYDFSDSQSKAYSQGVDPMKLLNPGIYGMISADGNSDGGVDAFDFNVVWRPQNGTTWDYSKYGDFNLDGGIDALDFNLYWRQNNGKGTQVP